MITLNLDKHLWFGSDSAGRSVEVATVEGYWFARLYEYNGYGKAWSKWWPCDPLPIDEDNCAEWGFSRLQYAGINNRLKLPV